MHRVSEWMRFYDNDRGRYRYRHKGTGVVRDTLLTIGKQIQKMAAPVVKKIAEKTTEKAAEKAASVVTEKGGKNIRQILQNRKQKKGRTPPKTKPTSKDSMVKLAQILANEL